MLVHYAHLACDAFSSEVHGDAQRALVSWLFLALSCRQITAVHAQLSSEVKALQAQAASLQQQLEAAQAAATDAQQARDALAALAERDADTSTALQQQLVAAEGRMEAVVRERDMLDEKIGQLRTENKRLNEALADSAVLQERLAAAEAAVEAGQAVQARVAQLQGVNERLQREHASVNGMVARLEAKLRQVGCCAIVGVDHFPRKPLKKPQPLHRWMRHAHGPTGGG